MNLSILLYLGPGLFRTVIIIVIIYFGLRFIKRYVMPTLIDKGVKNMQQKMQNQQRQQQPKRPEGEVTIEKNRSNDNASAKSKGDYVDFEEVD